MMLETVDKDAFIILTSPNNLLFICRFKAYNLEFYLSVWHEKYLFSAETWFVKTSTRIAKYESRVAKSNPDFLIFQNVQSS